MLKKLFSKSSLPILVGVVMVFGLFGAVMVSQQQQDQRSSAAGRGGTGNCTTVGPGQDLTADDCTIDGGFNGSIFGSRNTIRGGLGGFPANITGDNNIIMGGMNGTIRGNGNDICGGLNGGINGNNNIIHGGVGGPINGTGNITNASTPCGVRPSATISPTLPPATCADGIDNNQNELIDGGDPACHTDGNQNNPNTYDPTRNEGSIPTVTPRLTITVTPPVTTPVSRCSDNIDNDNNGFKDSFDSTCHTDNNPNNPNSYDPTRPGEQGGGNTCADSRDNNNNGVIDGGDPICHTDGNPNNPNSYDPSRNETSPTTPPTLTPTPTRTPTSTPVPGNTSLVFNLLLHGIGSAGDSANPGSGGNQHPLHPQRNVRVEVLNAQNQLILTKDGVVNFSTTGGNFTGTVDAGTTLVSGVYTIKVKTNQFLKALTPGIQNIIAGGVNQMPQTTLINGEINGDNTINILDYNILIGCYSDLTPAVSCTAANNLLADLDDDGHVNQFDYNLFLRELTNRQGV